MSRLSEIAPLVRRRSRCGLRQNRRRDEGGQSQNRDERLHVTSPDRKPVHQQRGRLADACTYVALRKLDRRAQALFPERCFGLEFLKESVKTLDNMGFAIRNRLALKDL